MKTSAALESSKNSSEPRSRQEGSGFSPSGFEAQDSRTGYALPVQAYGGEYEAQTDFPVQMIPYGTLEAGSRYRYLPQPGDTDSKIGTLVEAKSADEVKFDTETIDSDALVLEKIPESKFDAKSPAAAGVPTLDFCACGAASLELRVEFNRKVLEDFILRHADDREAPVRIISIGSGGLFQDFSLLRSLLKAGFANVTVDLIDTNYTSDGQLQKLGRAVREVPQKLWSRRSDMVGMMGKFLREKPVIDREKSKAPLKNVKKKKDGVDVMAKNITDLMFGAFYSSRQQAFKAAVKQLAGEASVELNFHSDSADMKFSGDKSEFATTMVMAVDVPGIARTENTFLRRVTENSGHVIARTLSNSIKDWKAD